MFYRHFYEKDIIHVAHLSHKQPHVCAPIFNRHFCRGRFDSVCPFTVQATPCLRPNIQPAFLRKRYYSCCPSIAQTTPCLCPNIQPAFLPRKIWISLLIYCTSNPCCASKFNQHFCRGRFDWGYPSIAHTTLVASPYPTGLCAKEDLIQLAHLLYKQPHVCAPIFNRHFCRERFESGCPSIVQATPCLRPDVQPAFLTRKVWIRLPIYPTSNPCLHPHTQPSFLPRKIWFGLLIYRTRNPMFAP